MGDVAPGPQHDADVAADALHALTGRKTRGAGRLRSHRDPHRGRARGAGCLATPSPRLEARPDRARGGAGSRGPEPAPGPERWAELSAAGDEYRRVTATGAWIAGRSALVQAVTELGGGYWVMTPLAPGRRDNGPRQPRLRSGGQARPCLLAAEPGPVTVTGLLRMPEPGGAFLRSNDPAADRWFSRDVAAIAASRGLSMVAPYFIDAGAEPRGRDSRSAG